MLHIIHLPHRTDRYSNLIKELLEQEIEEYQIWPGIINPDKPQIGISQAHKQVVQYAIDNKLSEVLIAEDDVKFTASGAFAYFIANKP